MKLYIICQIFNNQVQLKTKNQHCYKRFKYQEFQDIYFMNLSKSFFLLIYFSYPWFIQAFKRMIPGSKQQILFYIED